MGVARSALRLVAAQARACAGFAAAFDPPLVGTAVRRGLGRAREEESELGGVAATVFRPSRGLGPWPAVVLYPGVTREGRRHAAFVGLGRGLAAAGCLAVVAEPEGLSRGELTGATAAQALAAARAVASRRDATRGHVALVGVSGGATLALRVAATPELAGRVTTVLVLAPVCDLEEAIRFATTGFRRENGRFVPFATQAFFQLVCARSVVASLAGSGDRDAVLECLRALPDYGDEPLEAMRELERPSDAGVQAALELFANRDRERFDALLAGLPSEARESLASLSTVRVAATIRAPVEVVVARADKYVPLADAQALVSACRTARLTILDSLEHAVPRLAPGDVRDLGRLNAALVRMLAASYSR